VNIVEANTVFIISTMHYAVLYYSIESAQSTDAENMNEINNPQKVDAIA
jgi:uncharacterized membrane protein